MGIQIVDEKKLLSKHQQQKIKKLVSEYLQENDTNIKELDRYLRTGIVPQLTFTRDGQVYNHAHHRVDEGTGHIQIVMGNVDTNDMRRRLKEKVREKSFLRRNSDDEKSRMWKVYENMKKYSPKSIRIPSPTEIVEQRGIFQEMLEKMPNSDFKHYVQDCLN